MERPYTRVMLDIAKAHENAGTDKTLIPSASWPDIIRELAELPEDEYRNAVRTIEILQKVAAVAERTLH